jgi:pimeloyl-[acyl-carrier protein] synthase
VADRPCTDDGLEAEGRVVNALFSPEGRSDPHAVFRLASLPGCSYAIVNDVLRDSRFSPIVVGGGRPFWDMFARWLISLDGERHRAMRGRFSRLFTAARVEGFRSVVTSRVDKLLDGVLERGRMDLITDFARPLPFSVIVSVLGVPPADREWVAERMLIIGQAFPNQRDAAYMARADQAVLELSELFSNLLDRRAERPEGDLLSALASEDLSDAGARADVVANCVLFISAGHQTTTTLIAGGILLLLERPEHLDRLRNEPAGMPNAVEEMLRMISPITVVPRHPNEDVTVGGCPFPAGVDRFLFLPAANRDPEAFPDPDRFDPDRTGNRHLAFAAGDHFCVGAPLARLHGEVAIGALVRRLSGLRLDGDPEWRGSIPLRELEHLPVAWDPAAT